MRYGLGFPLKEEKKGKKWNQCVVNFSPADERIVNNKCQWSKEQRDENKNLTSWPLLLLPGIIHNHEKYTCTCIDMAIWIHTAVHDTNTVDFYYTEWAFHFVGVASERWLVGTSAQFYAGFFAPVCCPCSVAAYGFVWYVTVEYRCALCRVYCVWTNFELRTRNDARWAAGKKNIK